MAQLDLANLKNQLKTLNSSISAQEDKALFQPLLDRANNLATLIDILEKRNPGISLDQVAFTKASLDALQTDYNNLWNGIGKLFKIKLTFIKFNCNPS